MFDIYWMPYKLAIAISNSNNETFMAKLKIILIKLKRFSGTVLNRFIRTALNHVAASVAAGVGFAIGNTIPYPIRTFITPQMVTSGFHNVSLCCLDRLFIKYENIFF